MLCCPRLPSLKVRIGLALLCGGALLSRAPVAEAIEPAKGRVQLHGYAESQLRALSDGYHNDRWYWSQWANVLSLELEADIAPKGFGPFSLVQGYGRADVRYDCVWSRMCGLGRSMAFFGDRASRAPKNLTTGRRSGFTGVLENPDDGSVKIHDDAGHLLPFTAIPPFDTITALGGTRVDEVFAPVLDARFAMRDFGGTLGPGILPLGPWLPKNQIHPNGVLQDIDNTTSALPFRPLIGSAAPFAGGARGLYAPSRNLRDEMDELDSFDQNFSEEQLEWNHGAGQDENELKELYLDLEALDGRLWMRLGKQSIVWGKTELFRTTDQFNPQDLALASLPSLEESRLSLWSARFIYSLFDVGPLEDVRIEFAANFDDHEPADLGRCGEPYSLFLVCGKSVGLFAHGVLGAGLAGEVRPPNPWNDIRGLEIGGRVEWRWDRFSFALTDYWGYSDFPTTRVINTYRRGVEPSTGLPVDVDGRTILATDADVETRARDLTTQNRQFYDVFCAATVGVAGGVLTLPGVDLDSECALSLFNSRATGLPLGTTIPNALSVALTGGFFGEVVLNVILSTINPSAPVTVTLQDIIAQTGESFGAGIRNTLTAQQQALLGCGSAFGTDCHDDGIDLYNAEASVLLQAFPMFEGGGIRGTRTVNGREVPLALIDGGPVATRYVDGRIVQLPGARSPLNADGTLNAEYDPRIDGCVNRTYDGLAPAGYCSTARNSLGGPADDLIARGYPSELAALSANFRDILAALGASNVEDTNCSLGEPANCALVRAIFGAAGTQRPDLRAGGNGRYGRRDFFWHSGSELILTYNKRNVLGLSLDFAEDRTKTNWGVEMTWVSEDEFANSLDARGFSESDVYNLTVSVDRPTFVNFINPNRTLLFNSQWFMRLIEDYQRGGGFTASGPFSLLGTFTVMSGYFQDRLLPAATLVHDVPTASGAILFQTTYRFNQAFSATVGLATFYGKPERQAVAFNQAVVTNNGGSFEARTRYDGLSALAERDEAYLSLRYTF